MLKKAVFVIVVTGAWATAAHFDLFKYFNLEGLQDLYRMALEQQQEQYFFTTLLFWILMFAMGALCLPGISGLFLLGGAAFGSWPGSLLSLSGVISGTTLAFLVVKMFFAENFQSKFHKLSKKFEKKLEEEGTFYLFSIRLVPVIPYFTISLAFAFTPIKLVPFYIASFLGMIPVTLVYSFLGASLAESFLEIEKVNDVITTRLIVSLSLLGLLPWISKKFLLPRLKKTFAKKNQKEKIAP